MSSNTSSTFEGNSAASALYDVKKKEVTQSVMFSATFLAVGLISIIWGFIKYLSISKAAQDSSENIDAWAWLIIVAVGAVVAVIGVIGIIKAMISYGQISSSIKGMESRTSPYQVQTLNRRAASMNQSQSLEKPAMEGMAENNLTGNKLKTDFRKERAEEQEQAQDQEQKKRKSRFSKLYDKYNPETNGKNTSTANRPVSSASRKAPPKSAPIMEQKFDYGIHEEKKLSFADEFLLKNKKDPFEEYRKDLGIEDEEPEFYTPKPQFIKSSVPQQQTAQSSKMLTPLDKSNTRSSQHSAAVRTQSTAQTSLTKKETEYDGFLTDTQNNFDDDGLDLNLGEISENDTYDFSLFEEFMPDKKAPASKPKNTTVVTQTSVDKKRTSASSHKSVEKLTIKPDGISSEAKNRTEYAKKASQQTNDDTEVEPELTYDLSEPSESFDELLVFPDTTNSKAPNSNSDKYNFETFSEKSSPKTTKNKSTAESAKKTSFSVSSFLSDKKSEQANISKASSSTEHEICTNGTRSQRKFVDASEYDEWKCPDCGKVNQEYVGVCCCGTRKPHSKN